MTRFLIVGAVLAAALTTGALAQSSSSSMPSSGMESSMMESSSSAMDTSSSMPDSSSMMDSSAMSSQMSTASSMDSSMMSSQAPADTTTRTTVQILSGYTTVDTDRLASKIIGQPVYDGKAKDANNLGNITDLVLGENGQVAAVVVGVGGFLGLGEKQVAVDFTALQFVVADDNTERYVLQTTKDELTNAPDFKTVDDNPAASSAATDTSASTSTMTEPLASSSAM